MNQMDLGYGNFWKEQVEVGDFVQLLYTKYVIPFQDCMYKTNKYEDRWNQNEGRNYFELDKPSI